MRYKKEEKGMPKITFLGAGSTVFAKNVLGDCMMTPALRDSHIALYDIDLQRLKDSEAMLNNINKNFMTSFVKIIVKSLASFYLIHLEKNLIKCIKVFSI